MVMGIYKIYIYWIILSETTSAMWLNRKLVCLHCCSRQVRRTHPWYIRGFYLQRKQILYDFLSFAAETRDTFNCDADWLTSVFLALCWLKVVTFVWGIEWVMRRGEAQAAILPLGCHFSKVASLQIGPVAVTDGRADKTNRNVTMDWVSWHHLTFRSRFIFIILTGPLSQSQH